MPICGLSVAPAYRRHQIAADYFLAALTRDGRPQDLASQAEYLAGVLRLGTERIGGPGAAPILRSPAFCVQTRGVHP